MCGIVGWLGAPALSLVPAMSDALTHRGPDSEGDWFDGDAGVWLGHRRLSIIDLSEAGEQPMTSATGRYVITYNGEVYNYQEVRRSLDREGMRFRSTSDTEVLLAAVEVWGLERALDAIVGMFAFALWDRHAAALYLVRDRLGVKPLYYTERPGEIAFASELRALRPLPWVGNDVDTSALAAYFRHLAVPAPATIIDGVRKMPPASILRWTPSSSRLSRYWQLDRAVRAGIGNRFSGTLTEAADLLHDHLRDAVRLRMLADVPVGALLSGGVDSSLVVALMQEQASHPVRTFTIGFQDRTHDESQYAREVARHLGTHHEEHIFTPAQVQDLVPAMSRLHDEPFADVSSLPTHLICSVARRHVKVALSGDGGDELWGGYPRYFWADRIDRLRRGLGSASPMVAGALDRLPAGFLDGAVSRVTGGRFTGADGLSHRVRRFAGYLRTDREATYSRMITVWADTGDLLTDEPIAEYGPRPELFAWLPWSEQMMATDQAAYLPDDLLTKLDRVSMAVSLEAREPMLDHRLVELSWRMPPAFKLARRGDRGKLLLREVLYRYVPRTMIERPKVGFGVPLAHWMRGPLRAWVEDTLHDRSIWQDAGLAPGPVHRAWQNHLAGADHQQQIWTVLMYLQWWHAWTAA